MENISLPGRHIIRDIHSDLEKFDGFLFSEIKIEMRPFLLNFKNFIDLPDSKWQEKYLQCY